MNKLLQQTFILLSALFLNSCYWIAPEQTIDRKSIVSQWSLYQLNNEVVPTDSAYCMIFNDDGTGQFAVCTPDKHWNSYDRTYTYDETTQKLSIEGEYYNKYCNAVFLVNSRQGQTMKLTVLSLNYDGINQRDRDLLTLRRLDDLPREEFVGLWEGYEVDNDSGRKLGENRRWEYFDDGSFNYYHEKKDDRWQLKNDNDGHFFLCGDFLATTYQNDINEGTTGYSCECWYISIDNNTMNWMATRGGRTHRFFMKRVEE